MTTPRNKRALVPCELRITLDGGGVYYDPFEPILIDGLLSGIYCMHHVHGEPPRRDEDPDEIPLPLAKWESGGTWGWRASALFPYGVAGESIRHFRRRLRADRIERSTGSPNTKNGPYRDWDVPLPLILCEGLVGWFVGRRAEIQKELRRYLTHVGKKRAHGVGRVVAIDVDAIDEDWSLEKDGLSTRWTPSATGERLIRTRPPYWNIVGRVPCEEIAYRHENITPMLQNL